ncbi:helix-turn-helix domain-containing protein [Salinimicrobium sp. WS361]|uniref:helix-turn-helix domain-containing protein n=1 Tax=Salinimicrobium sp. WS361 TaxID=3425123 RepID=UPI003D7016E8
MSFFGKNIRKIRSVKSLSQQSFAELFDLKRATLGAYEEERSEPKIDTIIKIANHFSIPLDDLLMKELTVNKLLKFQGNLITDQEEIVRERFATVPCITPTCSNDYVSYYNKEDFIKSLPCLQLPVSKEKKYRGYTVDNLEMSSNDKGLFPKDVVIGEFVPPKDYAQIDNGCLVLVVAENQLILRKLYITKDKFILRAEHKNVEEMSFLKKEVKELWQVRYAFYHRLPEFSDGIEEKLLFLEREFVKMRDSR